MVLPEFGYVNVPYGAPPVWPIVTGPLLPLPLANGITVTDPRVPTIASLPPSPHNVSLPYPPISMSWPAFGSDVGRHSSSRGLLTAGVSPWIASEPSPP